MLHWIHEPVTWGGLALLFACTWCIQVALKIARLFLEMRSVGMTLSEVMGYARKDILDAIAKASTLEGGGRHDRVKARGLQHG